MARVGRRAAARSEQQGEEEQDAGHRPHQNPPAIEKQRRPSHLDAMQRPINVDLPHKLGRDEARRRIAGNIDQLAGHIPGGMAAVESNWSGDTLNLVVHAMGQEVNAEIAVDEKVVRCKFDASGHPLVIRRADRGVP